MARSAGVVARTITRLRCKGKNILGSPLQSDIKHVGAGFMPAFKFKQKIVLVIERGHKARAYVLALQLWRVKYISPLPVRLELIGRGRE